MKAPDKNWITASLSRTNAIRGDPIRVSLTSKYPTDVALIIGTSHDQEKSKREPVFKKSDYIYVNAEGEKTVTIPTDNLAPGQYFIKVKAIDPPDFEYCKLSFMIER